MEGVAACGTHGNIGASQLKENVQDMMSLKVSDSSNAILLVFD